MLLCSNALFVARWLTERAASRDMLESELRGRGELPADEVGREATPRLRACTHKVAIGAIPDNTPQGRSNGAVISS